MTKRVHYAWVIAGVTFLVLLITAGVRATPGVLIVPLETEFGWTPTAISGASAVASCDRMPVTVVTRFLESGPIMR
jgi:hypothetical protein